MEWIDAAMQKPEGEVFWALTEGRDEQGRKGWVIRRLLNHEDGDYRDFAGSYNLPGTHTFQDGESTIYAWMPLAAIPINYKD